MLVAGGGGVHGFERIKSPSTANVTVHGAGGSRAVLSGKRQLLVALGHVDVLKVRFA